MNRDRHLQLEYQSFKVVGHGQELADNLLLHLASRLERAGGVGRVPLALVPSLDPLLHVIDGLPARWGRRDDELRLTHGVAPAP